MKDRNIECNSHARSDATHPAAAILSNKKNKELLLLREKSNQTHLIMNTFMHAQQGPVGI